MSRAFVIHSSDNVATLLTDGEPGTVELHGSITGSLTIYESVRQAHKIAITEIANGDQIIKYGHPIGHATQAIRCGEWVHLHNCASNYDERSNTLDPGSGAPTDTAYV